MWIVGCLRLCGRRVSLDYKTGHHVRHLSTGQLSKLDRDTRLKIEDHWKPLIKKYDEQTKTAGGEKYYVLSMFPYPSGKLHMGHVRVYTISDTMARYHRMHGKKVIHPMGWDAFGLPAENAAIDHRLPPYKWTRTNIAHMKKQLQDMCYSFDWDREFATCDPDYYKWTQHIFLQMYHKGLVYRRASLVNWDPVDLTVLADEQIDSDGRSWRSGAPVQHKYLNQWYIKTTAYAQSLSDGLSDVDPDLWRDVVKLQKHWIGECTGTKLDFTLQTLSGERLSDPVTVFTETPELLYGVSYICLHPDHHLNREQYRQDGSNVLNIEAVNPVSGARIPLIISDQPVYPHLTDAKLGIPCIDDEVSLLTSRDVGDVTGRVLDEDGRVCNSGSWSGLTREDARREALKHAREHGYGGHVTSARLNDWLISRQRYWGTPIPVIHCQHCGTVPVPYEDLPVKLPEVTSLSGKGESPLAADSEWRSVTCPSCGGAAVRESDTMDTFVDSSWYYLRYLDPLNQSQPFSAESARCAMPVDLYIGGKEHATLHLYFTRFFCHFLYDESLLPRREPFINLLTQGMVLGQSYRVKGTGKYLKPDQIDYTTNPPTELGTGQALVSEWEKMSKSKYNGVDPETILEEHGVDSTRLCVLAGVAPKSDRKWQPEFFKGIVNWQSRIWVLVNDYVRARRDGDRKQDGRCLDKYHAMLSEKRNYYLNEYLLHMEKTFIISFAISRLQSFTNDLKKIPPPAMSSTEFSRCVSLLVMMMAPLSPMFASHLWEALRSVDHSDVPDRDWTRGVLDQRWPAIDPDYQFPIYVRSGHTDLFTIPVPYSQTHQLTSDAVLDMVRQHPLYTHYTDSVLSLQCRIEPGLRIEVNANLYETKTDKIERKKRKRQENVGT